jgi:hypothetical protein
MTTVLLILLLLYMPVAAVYTVIFLPIYMHRNF